MQWGHKNKGESALPVAFTTQGFAVVAAAGYGNGYPTGCSLPSLSTVACSTDWVSEDFKFIAMGKKNFFSCFFSN